METWLLVVIIFLCICFPIISIFNKFQSSINLPPRPPSIPILTNFLWLRRSPLQVESLLRSFIAKYGPILTLTIGASPAIFIADRSIAHKALLQNAVIFADRPPALATHKIISTHQYNLASAPYGPLWRLLRRNLTYQILHPSRIRSYVPARKWVLDVLLNRFLSHSQSGTSVSVAGHFQYAMFCLLVLMCFGDKLNESQIKEIEDVQRGMLVNLQRFIVLNFWPKLTNILFWNRKVLFAQLRRKQEKVLIPLINARKKAKQEREKRVKRTETKEKEEDDEFMLSYVDTLLDLELPDEKRKLNDDEMVTLSSEFLNAGTDTTSTTLQWIMANLVKYPETQNKLFEEMKEVMGDGTREEVKEEELRKLPYLKAVILEGLRRHPPVHFVIPHAVKEDTKLENYVIPKNGSVNFMVAEMGWDPKVWEDPMEFKPERFMKVGAGEEGGVEFDITGRKEIKMMPFGAGRRICPAIGLAMLHLEYFIANLVWRFQWKAVDEDDVDLAEKTEFTVVMKNPLKVNIYSRF